MTTANLILFAACAGAAAVEAVETVVILLAISVANGLRTALLGSLSALGMLAIAIAAGGVPLVHWVPLHVLQIVFGCIMAYVGAKWGRKAVLRASGRKATRDEEANYARAVSDLTGKERREGLALAFRQTMLEGFEVVLVVLAFGAGSGRLAVASLGAVVGCIVVVLAAIAMAPRVRRVPENLLKLGCAVLMLALSVFYTGEGIGVGWGDWVVIPLAGIGAAGAWAATRVLSHPRRYSAAASQN